MKTVFRDCKFLIPSADVSEMSTGQSVLVEDDVILAIGAYADLVRAHGPADDWQVVDCAGKLVMPGLVDGHNHLCNTHMNLSRAFGCHWEDITAHMLTTVHDPYGWHTTESLYDISLVSALNDIKHGATTIENSTIMADTAFAAMQRAGCRSILAPQMATSFQLENEQLNWQQTLDMAERCIREYHDPGSLSTVVVHVHDQWDTLEEVMLRGMRLAEKYDTKYVTHFWEFPDSRARADAEFAGEGGAFSHYYDKGLINDRCVFFHGSTLNEGEIDRLAETGASIIHNPEINGTNCGNCAYIPYMLRAGVNVGTGCDYGSLDVMSNIKLSLAVHNIMPREYKGISASQAFHMGTMGSARAYGMQEKIGSLAVGKQADIITFDLTHATQLAPLATSAIAYGPEILLFLFLRNVAGMETAETMVAGRFLRRDGRFLHVDEAEMLEKANHWFEKFLPDLATRRAAGEHYSRIIHQDFIHDDEVDLDALLKA